MKVGSLLDDNGDNGARIQETNSRGDGTLEERELPACDAGTPENGEEEKVRRGQRIGMIVKPTTIQPYVRDRPGRGHDTMREARSEGETGRQASTNRGVHSQ